MSPEEYGLGGLREGERIPAPSLETAPRRPEVCPRIGLFGCGGISALHLGAYARLGLEVVVLGNRTLQRAEARRDEFFPDADVTSDWRSLVSRDDVDIVDVALPVEPRAEVIAGALKAGKHVLSQKPFVRDLDLGRKLVELADEHGVHLAVNMNGRFAPHFAWTRAALRAGLCGELQAIDVSLHWDHSWTVDTAFDDDPDLLLFDFGIHWFDLFCDLFAQPAESVTAGLARAPGQRNLQAMLAQAAVSFGEHGRATLALHGASPHVQRDTTILTGTRGALVCQGPDLQHQSVSLHTAAGIASPELTGDWFSTGFEGAMLELCAAVTEVRQPRHSAASTMPGLALALAACESARSRRAAPL